MTPLLHRIRKEPLRHLLLLLTSPVIYGLFFVVVIADIFGTLYQYICFPVYRIPRVRRADYVIIDRVKLKQLNLIQKFNCLYCEYANGVIAYVAEITARTEWHWCPIKHDREVIYPHAHYQKFIEYDDTRNYRAKLRDLRKACRACEAGCGAEPKTP